MHTLALYPASYRVLFIIGKTENIASSPNHYDTLKGIHILLSVLHVYNIHESLKGKNMIDLLDENNFTKRL